MGRYQTAQGRPVQLWPAVENPGVLSASYGYWLHYRIGAWTVLAGVADRAMAAEVARNLDGRQTGDGFVVVQARGPFALSREYGEGRGAQLAIGDHSPLPSAIVAEPWRLIELSPARGSCQQEGVSGEHGSKCLGPGGAGIFANISGDPLWVKAVAKGLEARTPPAPLRCIPYIVPWTILAARPLAYARRNPGTDRFGWPNGRHGGRVNRLRSLTQPDGSRAWRRRTSVAPGRASAF